MNAREALEIIAKQCGPYAEQQPGLDYATIGNLARAALADAPTIVKVAIKREQDTDPDLSYLGEYSNKPGPADRTIDREEHGDMRLHEYCYFIAATAGDETGNPDSVEQDYQRMEAYNRGEWWMVSVYAVAEVSYPIDGNSRRIERFKSGRFWGIESDSDDYLAEVEQEQLDDLKAHLEHFGVDMGNWETAVHHE